MRDNEEPTSWDQFWSTLSKKDQKLIQSARRRVNVKSTLERYCDRASGLFQPKRDEIHRQIIANAKKGKVPEATPHAIIVIGPPASGKNTFLQTHLKGLSAKCVLIDNDEIKAQLPDFEPHLAGVFHEESSQVEMRLFGECLESQLSFVQLMVGKNSDKLVTLVRLLKEAGYEVKLVLLDLAPEEAARRALERFKAGGRFVDPHYIVEEVALTPLKTYVTLKKEVDEYEHYSAQEKALRLVEQAP